MDYHERKRRLSFGALTAIAAELAVSRAYVSEVVRLGRGSQDAMTAVAAVIGANEVGAKGPPSNAPAHLRAPLKREDV